MKTYGYVRVSTKEQNEARQMIAMEEFGVRSEDIYLDKQSGKDFNRPEYRDNIEEIRIEGHTNSNGGYYSNMELSQDRTRTVLQYCMSLVGQDDANWLMGLITANGLSSSHPIITNGVENKELSRRVEFRVRTNAEKQLEDIADKRFKKKK